MSSAASPADLKIAANFRRAWRDNPVRFSRAALGTDPWRLERRLMRAVAKPGSRVLVHGGHGLGKSFTAADLALWWLYRDGTVVMTAGKLSQVKAGMWHEMKRILASALLPFGVDPLATEFKLGGNAEILAWGAVREGSARGVHRPRLLWIGDEAEAIDEGLYRAMHGATAGGDVRKLLLGNPSAPSGPFHDAATAGTWDVHRWDVFDSPNLMDVAFAEAGIEGPERTRELRDMDDDELRVTKRDYLAGPAFVRETADEYGVDSVAWTWMVRGDFPQQSSDSLILAKWVERARAPREIKEDEPVEVGIDVAAGGDDEHVVCWRRGHLVCGLESMRGGTPDTIRDWTIARLREIEPRPTVVKVDAIGVGAYLCPILTDAGYEVIAVKVSEKPDTQALQDEFKIKRDEYWWELRERFREGTISGVEDERMRVQLVEPRWSERAGRRRLESKEEMRKRGIRWSPDRAEALMLAFAPAEGAALARWA